MATDLASHNPMDIAIFAKAPQPGATKTRLIPALGAFGAARLQRRLTLNALRLATQSGAGSVTLWCAPDTQHRFFRALDVHCGVGLECQSGADLGARMSHAFTVHGRPLLLIGTDCPALQTGHLASVAHLLANGHDAVFIPAEDGGYVLVALQRPQPRLFENIDWGTDRVMTQTRRILGELDLRWAEPATLWDIDRPADLIRLRELPGWSD